MKGLPQLDMEASEIIRSLSDGTIWIVHNERTFEPYFLVRSENRYYSGDNSEVWNYIELINKLNTSYRANQKHEAVGSNQAA